jgi:hypothetical protein
LGTITKRLLRQAFFVARASNFVLDAKEKSSEFIALDAI